MLFAVAALAKLGDVEMQIKQKFLFSFVQNYNYNTIRTVGH